MTRNCDFFDERYSQIWGRRMAHRFNMLDFSFQCKFNMLDFSFQ
jgi:hypothetical protein